MEQLLNLLKSMPEYTDLTSHLRQGKNAAVTGIGQILLRMGLGTHADLYSGECLTAHFLNDGLDAVVTAGTAVSTDAQTTGCQGDIVKEDDDLLGRNVEVGGQLQNAAAGKIHISLGLQQKNLSAVPGGLTVQTLEFQFVNLTVQLVGKHIQRPETTVVAGFLIFLSGIAKTDDEPVFFGFFLKHSIINSS